MDGQRKREPYEFDNHFRTLPVKNRVKLIKTAKNILEVQKAGKENVLLADAVVPFMEMEKTGAS